MLQLRLNIAEELNRFKKTMTTEIIITIIIMIISVVAAA